MKRLEHFWRGLSHPKDQVSAIPPHGYGERFLNFITGIVKSPEVVAREREARNHSLGNEPATEQDGNETREPQRNPEDAAPTRTMAAVRSPSAERTNGAQGTILPVVEEAGEGSPGGRSRNGSARSENYEGAPMMKSDSGLGQPPPPPPPPPPLSPLSPLSPRSPLSPLSPLAAAPQPPTSSSVPSSKAMQKKRMEQQEEALAIRVTTVSSGGI